VLVIIAIVLYKAIRYYRRVASEPDRQPLTKSGTHVYTGL